MNKHRVKKYSDSTGPFALHAHLLCVCVFFFLIAAACHHFPGMNTQSKKQKGGWIAIICDIMKRRDVNVLRAIACAFFCPWAPGRGGRCRGWAIFSRLFRSSHLLWSTVSRAVPWWRETRFSQSCFSSIPCTAWSGVQLLPCSRWNLQWPRRQTGWGQSCTPGRQRRGCRCHESAHTEVFRQ